MTTSYDSGEPSWEAQQLQALAGAGKLNGVSPYLLARISQWESGFEVKGPGINSVGAGGYYGLKPGSTYAGGGSVTSSQIYSGGGTGTPAQVAEFDYESEVAAAQLKYDLVNFGSLQKTVNDWVSGDPSVAGNESNDVTNYLAGLGIPAYTGGPTITEVGTGNVANAVPQGNSAAGGAQPGVGPITGPNGLLTDLLGAVPWTRLLLVIIAVILLGIGIDKLFDTDKSPGDIVLSAPSTTARQAGAARSKLGQGAQPSSAPFAHARHAAEEGAEAAAA